MPQVSAHQLSAEAAAQDGELLARVRRQDVSALAELFDRHSSMVLSLALRILGDRAEAEALTQDVFLQLWRRAELLAGEGGQVTGWLASLTRNRAIDRRREQRMSEPAGAAPMADPAAGSTSTDDLAESTYATALRRAVTNALALLPEPHRVALVLAYFGGHSQGEMVELLATPPATIQARIRQAMGRLRDLLGEFAVADPARGAQA